MNDQFLNNFLSVSSKCCACLTGQSIGTLLLSQDLQLHLARIAFSCALTFCGHQLDEHQGSVTLILCHAEFETQWQDDSVFRGCPSWLAQLRVTLLILQTEQERRLSDAMLKISASPLWPLFAPAGNILGAWTVPVQTSNEGSWEGT